jgi:hypothetical protein
MKPNRGPKRIKCAVVTTRERKILRNICEPIFEKGYWDIKMNQEFDIQRTCIVIYSNNTNQRDALFLKFT